MALQHLLSLLMIVISSSAYKDIESPAGEGCRYSNQSDGSYFTIVCSTASEFATFTVTYEHNGDVRVHCYESPNWAEFHLGRIHKIHRAQSISFHDCDLPSGGTLFSITKQFIESDIQELSFQDHHRSEIVLAESIIDGFESVTKLSLIALNMTEFPNDLLGKLAQLTSLEIRKTEIRQLPDQLLAAKSLEVLNLDGNRLEIIKAATFKELNSLQYLNLSNNNISDIESGSFDDLQSLLELDLHSNDLQSVPEHIFKNLSSLRLINLSGNNLSAELLPQNWFTNANGLKAVFLNENQSNLTFLPSIFFYNLSDLEEIDLSGNGLKLLPADLFISLERLHQLRLRRNSIEKLPKGIFQECTALTLLDLSDNLITDLPDGIFSRSRHLKTLDLSRNRITTIRENFFIGLTSLKELNMERNGLKNIHHHSLISLSNLSVAKFSFNNLTSRVQNIQLFWAAVKNLEELQLAHNNISEILVKPDDYRVMDKLRKLSLGHNRIKTLRLYDLQNINNIEIDVSFNKIQTIQFRKGRNGRIEFSARNVSITISNNPVACDCNLYDLLRYCEGKLDKSIYGGLRLKMDKLQCGEPQDHQDKPVSTLQLKSLKCLDQNAEVICQKCTCWQRPEGLVYLIDCSYRNFESYPTLPQPPEGYKIELNLTGNSITTTPNMASSGYHHVASLILSKNRIKNISPNIISRALTNLKLDSNALIRLSPKPILDFFSNLTHLTLDDNPWACDCEAIDFIRFLQTSPIDFASRRQVRCYESAIRIINLRIDKLCRQQVGWIITVGVSIAILGIIAGSLTGLYYYYEYEIRVLLFTKGWCLSYLTEDDLDKDKPYDVFISYSHKDEEFIVNNLLPKLESGPEPFKLCVHYRDWLAGEWIPAQIARSVEDSKRTIIVMSPNFLESMWARLEFRAAHNQALIDGRARVIVVLYGDVKANQVDTELKTYLSMNTYVRWGDPWFWDKLRYALPHPRSILEKRKRKTAVKPQDLANYITNIMIQSSENSESNLV